MTIELNLLGSFGASADGRPIEGLRAPAPARLLAYLALHRGARPRRLYLAALFWPDGSDARARRRLSHTLWVLQSALSPVSPTLVQADRDTIGLDPDADLWVDVEVFENAMDTFDRSRSKGTAHLHVAALGRAIALYRGNLLGDHYDDWIAPIAQRVREKYLLGLRELVQLHKSRGDYGAALVSARQLVNETPIAEPAHAELMRLYWLMGRPDEAAATFDACRAILADQLGIEPGPELAELNEHVVTQRQAANLVGSGPSTQRSSDTGDVDTMVGRSTERGRLLDVVDSAFGGVGGFALVEGHAGMGKSKLLLNVAEAARWRGATVAWANHSEQGQLEPYGGLALALSNVLAGLRLELLLARVDPDQVKLAARVLPALATDAPDDGHSPDKTPTEAAWMSPDERWQLQEALTHVLVTLGAVAPTTLLLEDLQWCDLETLEFLRIAAPRLVNSQIAVLLSYRTQEARGREEVWNLLTDIEMRYPVTRVLLAGLDRDEIAALVGSRLSAPVPNDIVARLERATGGNPLFLLETIRAIERTASPEEREAVIGDQLGGRATVERVLNVLLREIDAATPPVQNLVAALAVWTKPATSTLLARLTDSTVTETLDAIAEGIESQLIAEHDGAYGLRFDQLAAAALARLPAREKRDLHKRAGDVLAKDPRAVASVLAAHYRQARSWPDAARYEVAAASRAAALHSYDTAVRFYELALQSLASAGDEPPIGLLFGLEAVLETLGRRDQQAVVLEQLQARQAKSIHDAVLIQRRQAMFLANTEALDDAIRVSCAAIGLAVAAQIDSGPSVVTLARILGMAGNPDLARKHLEGLVDSSQGFAELAHAHLGLGNALVDLQASADAETHLATALKLFREQRDTRGQVESLVATAVVRSQQGNADGAFALYHEALELARRDGIRPSEAMALTNLGLLSYMSGDASAALVHLGEAIDVFVAIGHRRGEARARANRAALWHTVLGDDLAAEREATLARRYFVGIGDRRHEAQCLDILAQIRRRKRSFGQSRRLLAAAIDIVRAENDPWQEAQMLRSLAWTECDAGCHDDALHALGKAIALAEERELEIEYASLLALEARTLHACDKSEQARDAANRSRNEAHRGSEMEHINAWWRYLVFNELGDHTAAQGELESAHEALMGLLQPFSETEREASLSGIAEHRDIAAAYAGKFARTRTVWLASASYPTGAPSIEVKWTIHDPGDLVFKDKPGRRRARLQRLLKEADKQEAHARVEDLANVLETSISTTKRDLAQLRSEGLIS